MRTMELEVVDWTQSRQATLPEVPSDTTVGELLRDLQEAMSLSQDTPYHLIYDGQKLNRHQTLEEVGYEDGEQFTIAPEVSAG